MRIQSIINTNNSLQVTYLEEADIDEETGVMEARTVDIPHAIVPQEIIDELQDITRQILDVARVARHRPVDRFIAPR